jgi:hypothetical protein
MEIAQQEPVPIPQDDEQRRIERMNAKHELHQRKLACAISHLEEYLIANYYCPLNHKGSCPTS